MNFTNERDYKGVRDGMTSLPRRVLDMIPSFLLKIDYTTFSFLLDRISVPLSLVTGQ